MIHTQQSFLPNDSLKLETSNYSDAGRQFGFSIRKSGKYTISSVLRRPSNDNSLTLSHANDLLQYAEEVNDAGICTIRGRNVMREYLDIIYGYCEGVGISRQQGFLQQVETSSGCQTMIIKHLADSSIGFLHTEENFEDRQLREIYTYIHTHPTLTPDRSLPKYIESKYAYTMVDVTIQDMSYTFFGYPDLCFGGPAMGCNVTKHTFMCVDSLYTKTTTTTQALWANAIATMFFLLGDINDIRELAHNLLRSGIYILNGYAFHIVNTQTYEITTFEFGGDQIVEVMPDRQGNIEYIAQPNYPRSNQLKQLDMLYDIQRSKKATDVWDAQTLLEMEHRTQDMKQICLDRQLLIDTQFHEIIQRRMQVTSVTLERDYFDQTLESVTGFISIYLAGYATGCISQGTSDIQFHKLFPRHNLTRYPKFWYAEHEANVTGITHLFEKAATYVS